MKFPWNFWRSKPLPKAESPRAITEERIPVGTECFHTGRAGSLFHHPARQHLHRPQFGSDDAKQFGSRFLSLRGHPELRCGSRSGEGSGEGTHRGHAAPVGQGRLGQALSAGTSTSDTQRPSWETRESLPHPAAMFARPRASPAIPTRGGALPPHPSRRRPGLRRPPNPPSSPRPLPRRGPGPALLLTPERACDPWWRREERAGRESPAHALPTGARARPPPRPSQSAAPVRNAPPPAQPQPISGARTAPRALPQCPARSAPLRPLPSRHKVGQALGFIPE